MVQYARASNSKTVTTPDQKGEGEGTVTETWKACRQSHFMKIPKWTIISKSNSKPNVYSKEAHLWHMKRWHLLIATQYSFLTLTSLNLRKLANILIKTLGL